MSLLDFVTHLTIIRYVNSSSHKHYLVFYWFPMNYCILHFKTQLLIILLTFCKLLNMLLQNVRKLKWIVWNSICQYMHIYNSDLLSYRFLFLSVTFLRLKITFTWNSLVRSEDFNLLVIILILIIHAEFFDMAICHICFGKNKIHTQLECYSQSKSVSRIAHYLSNRIKF